MLALLGVVVAVLGCQPRCLNALGFNSPSMVRNSSVVEYVQIPDGQQAVELFLAAPDRGRVLGEQGKRREEDQGCERMGPNRSLADRIAGIRAHGKHGARIKSSHPRLERVVGGHAACWSRPAITKKYRSGNWLGVPFLEWSDTGWFWADVGAQLAFGGVFHPFHGRLHEIGLAFASLPQSFSGSPQSEGEGRDKARGNRGDSAVVRVQKLGRLSERDYEDVVLGALFWGTVVSLFAYLFLRPSGDKGDDESRQKRTNDQPGSP